MNKCKYLLPCGRCDKFDKKCKVKEYSKLDERYKNGLEPIMNPPRYMNDKLPSGIRLMY